MKLTTKEKQEIAKIAIKEIQELPNYMHFSCNILCKQNNKARNEYQLFYSAWALDGFSSWLSYFIHKNGQDLIGKTINLNIMRQHMLNAWANNNTRKRAALELKIKSGEWLKLKPIILK